MRWREDWCCRRIAGLRRRVLRRSWRRPRRRRCRPVDAVLVAVRVRVGVRADPPVAVVVPALPWNRKLDAADEIGRWVVATVAIRVRVRTVSFARDEAARGRREVLQIAVAARGAALAVHHRPVQTIYGAPAWKALVVVLILILVPVLVLRAVVVVAIVELPLAVGVAVEVFVVIIGIRARFAGVPAFRGRRQVVHGGAVLARGAGVSAPHVPVVSALHRPVARGAVVVVVVVVVVLIAVFVPALAELPLFFGVAVDVFVVVNGIRTRLAGVSAAIAGR